MTALSYADLAEENLWLRERLNAVTGRDRVGEIKALLGCSPQCARLLALLVSRPGHLFSDALIYSEVFEHPNGEGPDQRAQWTILCRVRGHLRRENAPHGIDRPGHRGGLCATPALAAWVNDRIGGDA